MDRKDAKILHALDKNGRISFAQISKETNIPQETVRYRVDKLWEKGILIGAYARINSIQLGYSYYTIMFRLQNATQERRREITEYFIKDSRVGWVGILEGAYDIGIIAVIKNQSDLNDLVFGFSARYGGNIMKKSVSINISGVFFARDHIIGKQRRSPEQVKYTQKSILDPLDSDSRDLLRILSRDARRSIVDMAQEIGISADTVVSKMRGLDGVLLGYSVNLDFEKIGLLHYKLLLYFSNVDQQRVRSLERKLSMDNRVIAIIRCLGPWEYEADIEIGCAEDMSEIILLLTNEFSDLVRDYDVIRVRQMPKYTFYPD